MDNKFDEQEIYERLYLKMIDYKPDFRFTDFLDDIVYRTDKNFNKEGAYHDLEKIFDTFMEYHNEVEKYKQLEKKIGCPLEVRLKITSGTTVYTDWGKMTVDRVSDSIFTVENKGALINQFNKNSFIYRYSDHKKTWWLKKDRSE